MAGEFDTTKGHIKEGAGELIDDDDLKAEGKIDQTKGKAKGLVEKVGDKLGGVLKKH